MLAPRFYKLGISFKGAPKINDDIFVGRESEMADLIGWLLPTLSKQNIVVISGLGGMGKTQLSIHFANRHRDKYSSIIWLNAKDENTLKTGLAALASRILGRKEREVLGNPPDEDQAVQFSRQWLSESDNKEWLVIFDNYDDPRMPGIKSSTGYDIRKFFPDRDQGSILITTRSSRIDFGGRKIRLRKIEDLEQSLAILANVSGRETKRGEYFTSCSFNLSNIHGNRCRC